MNIDKATARKRAMEGAELISIAYKGRATGKTHALVERAKAIKEGSSLRPTTFIAANRSHAIILQQQNPDLRVLHMGEIDKLIGWCGVCVVDHLVVETVVNAMWLYIQMLEEELVEGQSK